jgi:hypothetical protein
VGAKESVLTGGEVVLKSSDVAEWEFEGVSGGTDMKDWYGCPPANWYWLVKSMSSSKETKTRGAMAVMLTMASEGGEPNG